MLLWLQLFDLQTINPFILQEKRGITYWIQDQSCHPLQCGCWVQNDQSTPPEDNQGAEHGMRWEDCLHHGLPGRHHCCFPESLLVGEM